MALFLMNVRSAVPIVRRLEAPAARAAVVRAADLNSVAMVGSWLQEDRSSKVQLQITGRRRGT